MKSQRSEQFGLCIRLATSAHSGQKRRGGDDYILHPIRVANRVRDLGYMYECIGLLHDVIEDSNFTAKYLLEQGVEPYFVNAVVLLTKTDDVSYENYLLNIKQNEYARQVKIADMLDNISDRPSVTQIRKYAKGLLILTDIEN